MLNKRFGSWIELDNALKDFHKMTHTHYVHAEMFRCTFGRKRKSEGLNVIKKPSKFLNCQSMFRVRLEGQQYVIKSYNMTHNHPCTSSWMVCDPLSRRLSSEEKENLKPVILHCQSTDEVIESIKGRTGKQVTAADVKNMKAELSTGWTRKQVLQMMRQNGQVREHAYNYDAPQRLIPLLNMLTPFARSKVLYELKRMRFVNLEYESGEWLFMLDRGQHYEVDVSICECNCSTFNMCRYPCRHLLLAYIKRRSLTGKLFKL
ncbi:unnamed protein product [Schistosoma haematobium]|nr:unnamed protein product [Schistosoma haematobium]